MAQKIANDPQAGAMTAINEALGLSGEEAHEPPAEEESIEGESEGEEGAESEDGSEDDAQGDAEGEGEEPTEEEKAVKEAEAKAKGIADGTRNPDGTFKKKEEVKKLDPINDPIPKDLKKETSDRMRSLIETAKTLTAERDQVRTDFETIVNGIKASGASPEQYGETISWLSLFNSQDPASRVKAYELVNEVADRLASMLNIDRTATDPLAKHPDLKQAVQANQIALPYAKEIARTRDAAAFRGQLETGMRQQQTQSQQQQQELETARAALNTFEQTMRASDPLYQQKRDAIVPALKVAFQNIPPSKWLQTFENAYKDVRVRPQGKPAAKPGAGQQPLRGNKNPAGGQARGATSMLDAINGALAGMPK